MTVLGGGELQFDSFKICQAFHSVSNVDETVSGLKVHKIVHIIHVMLVLFVSRSYFNVAELVQLSVWLPVH